MRDGTRLNTEIYRPRDAEGPVPILLNRAPYGSSHDEEGFHTPLSGSYKEMARDGYMFGFFSKTVEGVG